MKNKLLVRLNAVLAFLLGAFGLTGCMCKYGVPYAEFNAEGMVTDQETGEPIENIRVQLKENGYYVTPEVYTDENGKYVFDRTIGFPYDSIDIIAQDTAGVYEADSVRVGIIYEKQKGSKNDEWYTGGAFVYQDFKLKKK